MTLRVKLRRKPVVRLGGKPQRKMAGKLTKKRAIRLMSGLSSGCLKASKTLVGNLRMNSLVRTGPCPPPSMASLTARIERASHRRVLFGEPWASKDENSGRNEALHMDRTHAPPSGLPDMAL